MRIIFVGCDRFSIISIHHATYLNVMNIQLCLVEFNTVDFIDYPVPLRNVFKKYSKPSIRRKNAGILYLA